MDTEFESRQGEFLVLVNEQRQFSLWPVELQAPSGWLSANTIGSREECLAWIESNWTDLRPLNLRRDVVSGLSANGIPDK